jgi:hypothetical protein
MCENEKQTLNSLTQQGAALFPQGMHHHTQLNSRSLICLCYLFSHPFSLSTLWGVWAVTIHIDIVAVSDNISWSMFDTVNLFCCHVICTFRVFEGENFPENYPALVQESANVCLRSYKNQLYVM